MAVTVTDLRVLATNADTTTGWTGSNALSVFTAEPSPVQGTGSLGQVVSNATHDAYFTLPAAVNMSAGTLVYVWMFSRGELDTTVNGGLQVLLGDGTNRIGFHVAGSDRAGFRHENGPVGWQCLIVDTANLPAQFTVRAGSRAGLNLNAITQLGGVAKTLVKSVGGVANIFYDAIYYGNGGLRVTGGTTGAPGKFSEIALEDQNRGLGVIRTTGAGSYGAQGPMTFGGPTGTNYFNDANASVVFEARGQLANKNFITVEGNAAGTNSFVLGEKVGDQGLQGCSITAPVGSSWSFNANDANVNIFRLYGSTFSRAAVTGLPPASADREVVSCQWQASGEIIPQDIKFQFNTIIAATLRGLRISSISHQVTDCQFIANPRAIHYDAAGTYIMSGIDASGNTYDVENSTAGAVVINAVSGTNLSTFINTGGGSTTINNTKQLTLTGLQLGTEVRIINNADDVELGGEETINSGSFTFAYNYTAGISVRIIVHNVQYQWLAIPNFILPDADTTIPIQQIFDRQYNNP